MTGTYPGAGAEAQGEEVSKGGRVASVVMPDTDMGPRPYWTVMSPNTLLPVSLAGTGVAYRYDGAGSAPGTSNTSRSG